MQEYISALVKSVVPTASNIEIEVPKNAKYGDYSTNIAIILSRSNNTPPQETANEIAYNLKNLNKGFFSKIDIAGPGFINFSVSDSALINNLAKIIKTKERYGSSNAGKNKRLLLEFVSANPTGPLHIGHGRWAVIGDCLANLLSANGYKVDKEFYVNDAGEQVQKLVRSIRARMEGNDIPEGGYAGAYITELAVELKESKDIQKDALQLIISGQKQTLNLLGVHFNRWFYETEIHKKKLLSALLKKIESLGLTFHEDNAIWFKSSEYGDDKNRVLVKDDGTTTYFAADIAYHIDKFNRGYDKLINVWGTDHHGYVARLKAALTALGYPAEKLEIVLGQLVALYRGKELIRMSKRTGDMITLQEVIDEIGKDATRYFLAKNSPNTHLDFDLELAKSKTLENPVYYVGYAHARICSIITEGKKSGLSARSDASLKLLDTVEDRSLMLKLLRYEDETGNAARSMQPHRLTAYAEELSALFHSYYHKHRIITDNRELSCARLSLVLATSIVLRNVLKLLGITAPEHM